MTSFRTWSLKWLPKLENDLNYKHLKVFDNDCTLMKVSVPTIGLWWKGKKQRQIQKRNQIDFLLTLVELASYDADKKKN